MKVCFIFHLFWIQYSFATLCPDGAPIFTWGISPQGKRDVVDEHNKYRRMISSGTVANQPKGKNLLNMTYDDVLGDEAKPVSQQCKNLQIIPNDARWNGTGQNIYQVWSRDHTDDEDWASAVAVWWSEKTNFKYPWGTTNGGETRHYTQVVWATSHLIGCNFISFFDGNPDVGQYPYSRMYTCNYGSPGNEPGIAPYERT